MLPQFDAILKVSSLMEDKMQKWEYATIQLVGDFDAAEVKVIIYRREEREEPEPERAGLNTVLAELGDEGWELVTMNRLTKSQITNLLKRPFEDEPKEMSKEEIWEDMSEETKENIRRIITASETEE
jgi:hypothetical protein